MSRADELMVLVQKWRRLSHELRNLGERRLVVDAIVDRADELEALLTRTEAAHVADGAVADACECCGLRVEDDENIRTAISTLADFNPGATEFSEALETIANARSTGQTSDARDAYPTSYCYSTDHDHWCDCPDDAAFVDGLEVGDEYKLEMSVWSFPAYFRVTKVPDDVNGDYAVERIAAMSAKGKGNE